MTVAKRAAAEPVTASPKKKANAKAAASASTPVPVGEAQASSAEASSTLALLSPPKPELPSAEQKDTDTLAVMRVITKYVKCRLRVYLKESHPATSAFPDVELHDQMPLNIKKAGSDQELLSYKAAWDQNTAAVSFDGTKRYEAGGNIFWLHPFCESGGDEAKAAGETPSWAQVHEMANLFRLNGGNQDVEIRGGTVAKEKRMFFAAPFQVHASTLDAFVKKATFPGTLKLVTGHVILYAWYVAMCEALDVGGKAGQEWVLALWQAALTASIHADIITDDSSLAVTSLKANNEMYLRYKNCSDSFPSFAKKLEVVLRPMAKETVLRRLQHIQTLGIRYNGGSIHRNMLLGAVKYSEVVDDSTHRLFMKLEMQFGKDVLTDKWNNMTRIMQICGKAAEAASMWSDGTSTSDLIGLVVRYIAWALENEEVSPSNVTGEWLEKKRDGSPGVVTLVLLKALLVSHIRGIVAELPTEGHTHKEMQQVGAFFVSLKQQRAPATFFI